MEISYLETLKFNVDDFSDSISAGNSFAKFKYDICVFDIVMKGKNGYELLQDIRKIDPEVPVMFLTARNEKEDRIKAFKLGCDDYMTKPFSAEELTLRIEAILRRTKRPKKVKPALVHTNDVYHFGNFTFDFGSMQLIHPSNTRPLTRKEAELLRLLCENMNKLMPREVILRQIKQFRALLHVKRPLDIVLHTADGFQNLVHHGGALDRVVTRLFRQDIRLEK